MPVGTSRSQEMGLEHQVLVEVVHVAAAAQLPNDINIIDVGFNVAATADECFPPALPSIAGQCLAYTVPFFLTLKRGGGDIKRYETPHVPVSIGLKMCVLRLRLIVRALQCSCYWS